MAEFAAKEKTKEKTKENRTGIPTQLKERMEQRTGLSFDDVRVRYNSDMPARLGALAYTQGNQVEIGPGQERHLPHELGHVVQQKLGLVRANVTHPSGVAMNTEEGLERQADEIGAGGSIHMSPSGNVGTDIVQRYVISGDFTFAKALPGKKHKVMVKEGEPASVYFEESVGGVVHPLDKLGIQKTGEAPVSTKYGLFYRFSQGRIPNVRAVPKSCGYQDIEPDTDQPTAQYLRPSDRIDDAKKLMENQIDTLDKVLERAKGLRKNLLSCKLSEIAGDVIQSTDELIVMYSKIKDLKQGEPVCDEYIAMLSLGQDIGVDILTLNSIAKQSVFPLVGLDTFKQKNIKWSPDIYLQGHVTKDDIGEMTQERIETAANHLVARILDILPLGPEEKVMEFLFHNIDSFVNIFRQQWNELLGDKPVNVPKSIQLMDYFLGFIQKNANDLTDKLLALNISIEDIAYRKKQVELESKIEIAQYCPQMPTGCDRSTDRRAAIAGTVSSRTQFSKNTLGKFLNGEALVHWKWHAATPVHLPELIGSGDCLFIEDAVGKSSDEHELANAHWVANIYGKNEDPLAYTRAYVGEDQYQTLDCRFNKLSTSLRRDFFERLRMNDPRMKDPRMKDSRMKEDRKIAMNYAEDTTFGEWEFAVKDYLIQYKYVPLSKDAPPCQPYMKHFVLNVAKTITDEFVQLAFIAKDEGNVEKSKVTRDAFLYVSEKAQDKHMEARERKKKTKTEYPEEYTIEKMKSEIMSFVAGK